MPCLSDAPKMAFNLGSINSVGSYPWVSLNSGHAGHGKSPVVPRTSITIISAKTDSVSLMSLLRPQQDYGEPTCLTVGGVAYLHHSGEGAYVPRELVRAIHYPSNRD